MPAASKDDTPVSVDEEILEGRCAELGGYTVGLETFRADADPAPLFRGPPDDRCQCPHWGYVVSGKIVYRYATTTCDRPRRRQRAELIGE